MKYHTKNGKFEQPRKKMVCVICGEKKDIQTEQEEPVCDGCIIDALMEKVEKDARRDV
jgi:hypothetical protein